MKCPHCGFDDPETLGDNRFCTQCGKPRASAAEPRAPSPAPPERPPWAVERNARLVGLEGPMAGEEIELTQAEVSIGRHPQCDLVLKDPSVGRWHARIRQVPGGYELEDGGSLNGTEVSGVQLTQGTLHLLEEHDVIRFGSVAFEFHAGMRAPVPRPPDKTMVDDVGEAPAPFTSASARLPAVPSVEDEGDDKRVEKGDKQRSPRDDRMLRDDHVSREDRPVGPIGDPEAVRAARRELAQVGRELGPFIHRLDNLAELVRELEAGIAQLGPPPDPPVPPLLRQLTAELETADGQARYRKLQRLLDDLRADPGDVKLLLRLSEELPTISRLVEVYLETLSGSREP
jgi:hypothetical protein